MGKNILFVCKYNRFRSKVAEAIFNKYNKNHKYKAKSGGLFPGRPITKDILKACDESGFRINKNFGGTTRQLLRWSDVIIVIANDIPTVIFNDEKKKGKKLIQWKVKDVDEGSDVGNRKKTIKLIERKIKNFLGGLG